MSKTKEPTTRAGILASGLVRIVKTPAQLQEDNSWWTPEKRPGGIYAKDEKRAHAEGMKVGAPRWLKSSVRPADEAEKGIRESATASREAAKYIGGRKFTPPHRMSPSQLQTALKGLSRKLAGDDVQLDFAQE